jgi:CRISPR system Cascade subunit CasB
MNNAIFQERKFIDHLEWLVKEKDRGALAALRLGLGKPPGTAREMDRHVLPHLPPESGLPLGVKVKQEDAYYLVGALFAFWHQGKGGLAANPPENLGASLHVMVEKAVATDASNRKYEDKWKDAEKRIEKRLTALLNCHQDDLPEHLRHDISLLKAEDIPVNWLQLLRDIQNWHRESRDVQRAWARRFWRVGPQQEPTDGKTQPNNDDLKKEEQP